MSSNGPFRGDLEAAHRRIEQLTSKYETRIAALQEENARLRKRLIDGDHAPKRTSRALLGVGVGVLSSIAILVVVTLASMNESRHVEHEPPRPLLTFPTNAPPLPTNVMRASPQPAATNLPPAPITLDPRYLPPCKCVSGDPLCSEIPGQTCK